MKTVAFLFILLSGIFYAYGQDEITGEYFAKTIYPDETKEGYVENTSYNYVTSIKYRSLKEVLEETKETAENEMWTKEKLVSKIAAYKTIGAGGEIELYVERIILEATDLSEYTIIVKDTLNKELFRHHFSKSLPQVPSKNRNWWNIGLFYLPKSIVVPFYVYVVEAGERNPYKFRVFKVR